MISQLIAAFGVGDSLGAFLVLLYFGCLIALVVYILMLLAKFVSAHERVADALEVIASKPREP